MTYTEALVVLRRPAYLNQITALHHRFAQGAAGEDLQAYLLAGLVHLPEAQQALQTIWDHYRAVLFWANGQAPSPSGLLVYGGNS